MPDKMLTFENGLVTSRDPAALQDGELQRAEGCEYQPGSSHIYKQPGRKVAAARVGNAVQALQYFRYETAADKFVAYTADGAVYESDIFTEAAKCKKWNVGVSGLSRTAIPSFVSMRDYWLMCNGTDANYVREPEQDESEISAEQDPAFIRRDPWRRLGMVAPQAQLTLGADPGAASNIQRPTTAGTAIVGSAFTDEELAYDTDIDTYAYAEVDNGWGVPADDAGEPRRVYKYTFAADGTSADTNRVLKIRWGMSGDVGAAADIKVYNDDDSHIGTAHIVGTRNVGTFGGPDAGPIPYNTKYVTFDIPDGDQSVGQKDLTVEISVRAHVITHFFNIRSRGKLWLFDIVLQTQASSNAFSTTNQLSYAYTERYTDNSGVVHESDPSPLLKVAAQTDVHGITLSGFASSPENSFAQEYAIYRSIDEVGGGYPYMYEIAVIKAGTTSYVDIGETSFTLAIDKVKQLDFLVLLYPDGSNVIIPINGPPPTAMKMVSFQNSIVYVPPNSQRIHYSLPASISPIAFEKVPAAYYLDFTTPHNDVVRSVETANSGKSLIVYFDRFSMLVNFLPQATDPGVFDQRIVEYVSNTRGAVGPHATAEITLDSGRTLACAIDWLGLWVTDGISTIVDWSDDLDWTGLMAGIDLSSIRLVDNSEQYRLEMLYEKGGRRYEYHFFYNRLKNDKAPLITGPHPMGVRCKHYSNVNGRWAGWSGDDTHAGRVFVEREQSEDDAYGFDELTRVVPFAVQTGDAYLFGLGNSAIVTEGYPKFASNGVSKSIVFRGEFRRDGSDTAQIKLKNYSVNKQKKLYWSAYADRHNVLIEDISETALPALVAYEIDVRKGGEGKD